MLAIRLGVKCNFLRIATIQSPCRSSSALPKALANDDEFVSPKMVNVIVSKQPIRSPQTLNLIVQKTNADEWKKMAPNGLANDYLQLSKHRLTMLITATAMSGVLMAPIPINWTTLGMCAVGTTLMSASANACNHLLEAPYDAQMNRTKSRVLVTHRFSPLHAFGFATCSSVAGIYILYAGCNPLTAFLGFMNIVLYAGVYTPLKRYHIGCTWVGALVGAIPPLMGYAAMTNTVDMAALVLGAILFSWQFPHFNGLSWNLRGDYSRAGYRVMCVTNEDLCRKTTMRYSILLLGLCSLAAPLSSLTTATFALDSIPVNAVLVYLSYQFYQNPNAKTSRTLFRYSLFYLPLLMILMAVSNGGRTIEQNAVTKSFDPSFQELPGVSLTSASK